MKYSIIVVIGTFLLTMGFMPAKKQPVQLLVATSTHWAGGIVGRSGTNYTIQLNAKAKQQITIDKIWIKDEGTFALTTEEGKDAFYTVKKENSSATYTVMVKTLHNNGANLPGSEEEKMRDLKNPFAVSGEAVISYTCCKKQYYLPIAGFKEQGAVHYE